MTTSKLPRATAPRAAAVRRGLRNAVRGFCAVLCCAALVTLLVSPWHVARAGEDATIEGYWVSDGYGLFVEAAGNELIVSEITDISCIEQARYPFEAAAENAWTVPDPIDPNDAAIEIRRDPGPPERLHAHGNGAASEIVFTRSEKRPDVCRAAPRSGPLYNFDVFWQTFSNHYPVFKLKGIDWKAQRTKFRPTLSDESSDRELFDALVAMVKPLEDAHVQVTRSDSDDAYRGVRRDKYDTDSPEEFFARAVRAGEMIDTKYVQGPLQDFANDQVHLGRLSGNVGYLRITSFSDFGEGSFVDQLEQFNADLDEIFGQEMDALVIDLRLNLGGSDIFGQAICARLATQPYVAYRKVARNDKDDATAWTDPQPSHIRPRRPGFKGPVVVLISRGTISAGETFTQGLMGRRPEVVRIGQNTQGVFSDVLRRKLPNGWRFGLPNELFLDGEGRYYDGVGIAPHHKVAVFAREDLEAGRDPAIEKALDVLGLKRR